MPRLHRKYQKEIFVKGNKDADLNNLIKMFTLASKWNVHLIR